MPITLTVSDNQDGSGATAEISGSNSGATNYVWVAAVSGQLGPGSWVLGGTRIGDGAASLTLAGGYYWAYCVSIFAGTTALSNLYYFRASRASDPVLYRCLLATQARIQGLALAGLPGTNILVRKIAGDRDLGSGPQPLPAVQIGPVTNEQMNAAEATNLRDTIVYPVLVAILAADNQDLVANFAQYLGWRQAIARAFRNQSLVGVDEVYQCEIRPGEIISPDAFFRKNLFCSALVLNFLAREPRGIAT
jgi:hypothetical protein